MNFHTHSQSISTYLRFLLLKFPSNLLYLRFHSFSDGCRLRSGAYGQKTRQHTCLLGSIPVAGSRLFLLPVGLVSPEQDR